MREDAGFVRIRSDLNATLKQLEQDPDHPSLNPKPYKGRKCPHGNRLTQAYVQKGVPGAWRIWFCRCAANGNPPGQVILIVDFGPHP